MGSDEWFYPEDEKSNPKTCSLKIKLLKNCIDKIFFKEHFFVKQGSFSSFTQTLTAL